MRAEVGLLTRNIKVRGDSDSQRDSYGAHLMLTGSAENGFVGHVAYTEFTDCGQPKILGRYCIHFHMNGYVADSYVLGNAVHDSLARVVTLHGVHFLTVSDNVGYLVQGHNYFVEDGIETNNLIEHNLAISSIQAWTMLQTDISVASFWVTHPTNHFRYNHAAGSDFYGIWDNVAHSNKRFGLRIFKLAPRTYPCSPVYVEDQTDPWAANPGLVGTFSGYTLYKNQEAGLLAEFTANPFTHNINIQLDGLKNDPGYVFDPSLVGNKIFVVTGVLALYGTSPATVQTKLTASAFSGSTSISVDSSAGWAVGDLLVIAPSFSGQTEYERVKITGINGNNVNFAPALQYTHYGAPTVTINNIYGTLDTRAGVGHVTRNIKFISGDDSGWGYTLVVYEMWDGIRSRTGRAELSGV
ncbi:unnamed protein product [Sphagnum balticum]